MPKKVVAIVPEEVSGEEVPGRGLRNQLTQRAGEHFVAAEVNRRGAVATPFSGNMPGIDIIAFDSRRKREIYLQVKTKTKSKFIWHMRVPDSRIPVPRDEKEFYVFVDLGTGPTASPNYWIAPRSWIQNHIHDWHHAWLKKRGGSRPKAPGSMHSAIKEKDLSEWKDNWNVLGIGLS